MKKTSKESYDNPEGAQNYLDFLASEDGHIFRKTLHKAFSSRLGSNESQSILDVACGPGWLTDQLHHEGFTNIEACDGSGVFLEHAREQYPNITFTDIDLRKTLPYSDNQFETIIFSMAAHDVEDQHQTFTELRRILKPNGKLMITIVNPYYAFPVGVWKRGILGRLLFKKPHLKVRPYHWKGKQKRTFTFNKSNECYFYKLSEHLNSITDAGFSLNYMQDLESTNDSKNYNLQYRLNRFPILLYLEFTKKIKPHDRINGRGFCLCNLKQ